MLDLLDYAVKRAEKMGASQAEAYLNSTNRLQTIMEKKQVKISERKYDMGMGIRLVMKKPEGFSVGFAYLTNLTRNAVSQTVRQALKVASFKKPDPNFKSFQEPKPISTIKEIYDKKITTIESEETVSLARGLIEASSIDKRITTISGGIAINSVKVAIVNSLGVSSKFETTTYGTGAFVVAQEGNSVGVGWDNYVNCFYNEEKTFNAFRGAADLALKQLHPKAVQTQKMDLLMQPDALGSLLVHTLVPEVRADNVQKQQSPFIGKMGKQVSSENLTIVDDGRVPRAVGSKPFDDEGCPTQATTIIEKGLLKGFLYNSYTARKAGVESTGNAVRTMPFATKPPYTMEPLIGPTNFKISAGVKTAETSFEELVGEVENGVMAKGVIGAHTANAQSGEFSVALHCAFKIDNGEITYPVKQAMVGGNILDVIKNVTLLGDDVKHVSLEEGTLISPTILIKGVTVSG